MISHRYLFGAAAIGAVVSAGIIFSAPGSAGASSDETNMASFSVEASTVQSRAYDREDTVADREVRVIHPSPYQGVSLHGLAPAER